VVIQKRLTCTICVFPLKKVQTQNLSIVLKSKLKDCLHLLEVSTALYLYWLVNGPNFVFLGLKAEALKGIAASFHH